MTGQRLPGLTTEEAAARLVEHGPNTVPPLPPQPVWRRVARAVGDPMVLVLLAAVVLTLATGDLADTVVIAAVVVVNTVLAVRPEVRADRAVRALTDLAAPRCRVVRDGQERLVPSAEVVPGDVVVLAEGDLVAADARLVEVAALLVDESMLTGESVAVDKVAGTDVLPPGPPGAPGETRADMVMAGTVVVHGRGVALVSSTGAASALGRIAALLTGPPVATPLQRRMAQLSAILAGTAVALCAVVLTLGLLRGEPLETMLLTAVSLAVAAVPESLPGVVSVSLTLAARRMAARHAVARNLAAVETLGSVTLLATDKTGTLTRASMEAVDRWVAPGAADRDLLRAAALCNDARLGTDGPDVGDPTEVALLRVARDAGLDPETLRRAYPRREERAFDRLRMRMSTTHEPLTPGGPDLVLCKGAPETVVGPAVLDEPEDVLAAARERSHDLAAEGCRVLAFAQRQQERPSSAGAAPGPVAGTDPETGMRLLGLVALRDPTREAAAGTVRACQDAGIEVVLVTGDHRLTADAVARQVGISGDGSVIARATPADKLAAVRDWQQRGQVVAMTGDGVNDGPALRRADIGVAMGGRGTEVARQAADLILADDDLGTVVAAVEEGRRVYANIRRFLLYGISGGASEVAVMLAGPAIGVPLPLLPAQILWVNLLTHSFVGASLGSEPVEAGSMHRPPRRPDEGVLGSGLWWRILAVGALLAAAALAVGAVVAGDQQRSATQLTLGAGQLGVAWGVRARAPEGRRSNPALAWSVAGAAAMLAAAVLLPPLQSLLSTTPVDPAGWAGATGAALAAYLLVRVLRSEPR
ncbi:MAG: cation-translocating P-type ATPase [Oryzihumus sp.]